MNNKNYEDTGVEAVEIPGGDNVRLSYSRGITVNQGNFNSEKLDVGYAADVSKKDAPALAEKIKAFVDAEIRAGALAVRSNPA